MKINKTWVTLAIFSLIPIGSPALAADACQDFDPEPPHFKKLYYMGREVGEAICADPGETTNSKAVRPMFVEFARVASKETDRVFGGTPLAEEMRLQMEHFRSLAEEGLPKSVLPSFVVVPDQQSFGEVVFYRFTSWEKAGLAPRDLPECIESGGANCMELLESLQVAIEQYKKPYAAATARNFDERNLEPPPARQEQLADSEQRAGETGVEPPPAEQKQLADKQQQAEETGIEPPPPGLWQRLVEALQANTAALYVFGIFILAGLYLWGRRFWQTMRPGRTSGPAGDKTAGDGLKFEAVAPPEEYAIAEVGVSDAALDNPDDDLIGTSRLARGLSLFLGHSKTEPPLTLAITGPWGSGKSSIMGMLKAYLVEARYRPVWFNVWHHQDEEHFFGALLENIRKDGIPPLWHLSGMMFRLRLMLTRLRQRPLLLLLLGLLVLLALFPERLLPLLALDEEWETKSQVIAAVLAGVTLLDQFAAFGFSSKDFTRGIASSFRTINFEADAGLRYRVRQCLQDIHRALGDRTMVIFVDDLDRCPPQHVLKVLEVVNFLSSPPLKFFIVFGISLDKVIPIISPSFTNQVEEEFPPVAGEDEEARKKTMRSERLKLARQYMRKMINIEVSVPVASVQELLELAKKNPTRPARISTLQDEANRRWKLIDQRVFPSVVAAVLAGFLFLEPFDGRDRITNLDLFSAETRQMTDQPVETDKPPRVEIDLDPAEPKAQPADGPEPGPRTEPEPGPTVDPDRLSFDKVMPYVILVLIAAGALGALLRRESQRAQIGDSDTFLRALDIWAPVLNALDPTPRHYIRMLNQLRLLSMRMRLERDLPEQSAAQPEPMPGEVTGGETQTQSLSDDDLKMIHTTVLSALHELGIDAAQFVSEVQPLAQNPDALATAVSKLKPAHLNAAELEKAHAALRESVQQHMQIFPGTWPGEKDIDEFRTLMRGVQLS